MNKKDYLSPDDKNWDAEVAASRIAVTKWSGVTRQDLEGALAVVMHGHDPVAAQSLIEYFHDQNLDPAGPDSDILLAFVRHAFRRIVEDKKSADVAFGLSQGRGEYERPFNADRDVIAAAYVVLLMREGWTWLDAKGEAANLLFPDGRGGKAVEHAYENYKHALHGVPDQLLREMLPPGTPVIKRDMTG